MLSTFTPDLSMFFYIFQMLLVVPLFLVYIFGLIPLLFSLLLYISIYNILAYASTARLLLQDDGLPHRT